MYLISNNKSENKEGFHNNQTHQSKNRSIINRQPMTKNYPIVDKTDLRQTVQNYRGHKTGVEHYLTLKYSIIKNINKIINHHLYH